MALEDRLTLRQVRAARLRGRARKRAIIQVLLGSVFLIGALAYARAPDRHAQASITWMAALLVFSTADVAFGLRMLARLARRASIWWMLGSAAWGRWRPRCWRSCCGADVSLAVETRTVLITGCSSGIGRATAERFAARGWAVFATMRRPEAGAELRDLAASKGWRLSTPALDVTGDDSVASAVGAVLEETGGRLDVLVNNAGYYAWGPLEETSPDELRAQLETHVGGVHRVTRAVLPAMRARRAGAVVTLGSVSGLVALPVVGPYHASKWALEGMIEAWRLELAPFGVRVSLIEPGPFVTSFHKNELTAAQSRPDGPYAGLIAAYQRQSDRLPRAKDLTPVVDAIEQAATVASPRLRWPVGPTAFSARLRPFVPDRLYEWIMRIAFRPRRLSGAARAVAAAQPPGADPHRTDPSLRL